MSKLVRIPRQRVIRQAIMQTARSGNLNYIFKCIKKYPSTSDKATLASHRTGLANERGETPLIIASVNGHIHVVRFLVETAKVDLNEYGTIWSADGQPIIGTALHAAVVAGNIRVLSYLLEVGQSIVDSKTRNGSTPLHLAAIYLAGEIQRKIVHRLLFYGADFAIRDSAGNQCWQLTYRLDFIMSIVEFLDKFGLEFGVTAKIEQTKLKMHLFYFLFLYSATCIGKLGNSK